MDEKKLRIIAAGYVGTPHINGAHVKGAGVDCCTLIAMILEEYGYGPFEINYDYPADWYCRKQHNEILLEYLERYCEETTELAAGTIVSFSFARSDYAHLALCLGEGKLIHCYADMGTELTTLNNPFFEDKQGRSRITGYWKLKEAD